MQTKQECLLELPFEFIIAFAKETQMLRSNGYFTKKDYVHHLLKKLNVEDCFALNELYKKGFNCGDAAKYFNKKRPSGYLISGGFVNYLNNQGKIGTILYEFPITSTRVDILRLDGTSYAYEIKSQRDKLDRLNVQLPALGRVFDKVFVVFPFDLKEELDEMVDEKIGLYSYSINDGQIDFKLERSAILKEPYPQIQLRLLRMDELKALYCHYFEKPSFEQQKDAMISFIIKNIDEKQINEYFKVSIQRRRRLLNRSTMLTGMAKDMLTVDTTHAPT